MPDDKDFESFLNGDENENAGPENKCPRVNGMVFIVSSIREKMKFIHLSYRESLNAYEKLKDGDPLKELLKNHIAELMECSKRAIDQLDYALIEDGEDDDQAPSKEPE